MKLKTNITYQHLKSTIYLLIFTALISCQKGNNIKPTDDLNCSLVEVKVSCDRPSTQKIELIYSLLESHTTSGFLILNKYLDACFEDENKIQVINSYITTYGNPPIKYDTLASLNTVIHELTHGITGRYSNINSSFCDVSLVDKLWLDQQTEIRVKAKNIFPAKEIYNLLIPIVANNLYTSAYIVSDGHGSQHTGAYALLDEFNAYYQGLFTTFELYSAYNELYQTTNDATNLTNFIIAFENEILAYYSFKYYILLYKHHAKEKYPEEYENLKNNTDFWNAFNAVDEKFKTLLIDYKQLIDTNTLLSSQSDFDNLYTTTFQLIEEEIKKLE